MPKHIFIYNYTNKQPHIYWTNATKFRKVRLHFKENTFPVLKLSYVERKCLCEKVFLQRGHAAPVSVLFFQKNIPCGLCLKLLQHGVGFGKYLDTFTMQQQQFLVQIFDGIIT